MSVPPTAAALRRPRHLAIIMDGNGRWAQRRNRPRTLGHRAGVRAVKVTVEFCLREGIEALTLFAFSSENWSRPHEEVSALMRLFLRMLDSEIDELHRNGIRIAFIGDRAPFPEAIRERMARAEQLTAGNLRLCLTIAAGYGGRSDITLACREIARKVAAGTLPLEAVDETCLDQHVSLHGLPAPDLFIRTGGDLRISNFLLWQLAYTELWFTETLWPDLDDALLQQAVRDFAERERRFGLTSEQIQSGALA